ncbi:MAG TPA: DMT family transporter [Allosphingosinicella sp.]
MHPAILAAILGALLSGFLVALQAPTNAMLARGAGSPVNAALVSFAVGTAALALVAFVLGVRPQAEAVRTLPWYAWMGGLYGAVFVSMAVLVVPRVGVTFFLTVSIAGQLLMALMLDRVGAFGVPRVDISPLRLLGVAFVLVGAFLVRR